MRPFGAWTACLLCGCFPRPPVRPAGKSPVEHRYLNLPVKTGAPKHRMRYVLATTPCRVRYRAGGRRPGFLGLRRRLGVEREELRIEVDGVAPDFKGWRPSNRATGSRGPRTCTRRNTGRSSITRRAAAGLNDPNGLVYSDGEYHLFYQHNPYGCIPATCTGGHAVSPDLVHWKELPRRCTRAASDWCFSGSAVEDKDNTSGLRAGEAKPLVAAYASTGRGECIAYSTDRGRCWADFKGPTPLVKHQGRDRRACCGTSRRSIGSWPCTTRRTANAGSPSTPRPT